MTRRELRRFVRLLFRCGVVGAAVIFVIALGFALALAGLEGPNGVLRYDDPEYIITCQYVIGGFSMLGAVFGVFMACVIHFDL